MTLFAIVIIHQLFFQGVFVYKNIFLSKKLGKSVRGKSIEATRTIIFATCFIVTALVESFITDKQFFADSVVDLISVMFGIMLLLISLTIAVLSLMHIKDSWRVGIQEGQKTDLITTGIYRFSRNPYFTSYLMLFFGYAILLQSIILTILSVTGVILYHLMIRSEERFLENLHGEVYREYKAKVPRYLLL